MNKTVKWILAFVLFAAFFFCIWMAYQSLGEAYRPDSLIAETPGQGDDASTGGTESGAAEEKQPAFDFTVYDCDGNKVKLSDLFGKPIVLNFWASWCPPCKAEMPYFEEVFREYGEEVHFVMVNMTDGSRETVDLAQDFLDGMGYTFPVYFDKDADAALAYYVTGIPMTFFIDKDGYLEAYASSSLDKDSLLMGIETVYDLYGSNE